MISPSCHLSSRYTDGQLPTAIHWPAVTPASYLSSPTPSPEALDLVKLKTTRWLMDSLWDALHRGRFALKRGTPPSCPDNLGSYPESQALNLALHQDYLQARKSWQKSERNTSPPFLALAHIAASDQRALVEQQSER